MPATISLDEVVRSKVTQTFTGEFIGDNETIAVDGFDTTTTLNASSTPPATLQANGTKAMSAGTATIDFTALPGDTAMETKDATGLKLQRMRLKNPSTNANVVTVTKGASNGYGLTSGGASWTVVLSPGEEVYFRFADTCPDVAAGAKTLDLSGTLAQELDYLFIFG